MLQIYWCSDYLICTIFGTSVAGPNTVYHLMFFCENNPVILLCSLRSAFIWVITQFSFT